MRILAALDSDARLSKSELARVVGMSAPSVSKPVRRLESSAVIRSFTIDVDTRAIGYQIRAMVRPLAGKLHIVERLIQERPEFIDATRSPATIPFLPAWWSTRLKRWTMFWKRCPNMPSPARP